MTSVERPPGHPPVQPPEQLRYARWLEWGTRAGLVLLVASFVAYVSGLLPARVPVDTLPSLWGQPLATYLQRSGAPTGWGWLTQLGHGDVAALSGIVLLAACSLPALLALLPIYRARGDKAFMALCLAEVVVVVLAASNLLGGGH
jgi:hypothetical protein